MVKIVKMLYNYRMIVLLIIISVGVLGLIINFAVSPKSSQLLKFAATIALGLIGLAVIICGIIIFIGPKQNPDAILLPFMSEDDGTQPTRGRTSIMDIVIFAVLLGVIGLVIARSMKQQKKMARESIRRRPKASQAKKEERFVTQSDEDASFLGDDNFKLDLD